MFYSMVYSVKTGNRRKSRQKVTKKKGGRIGKSEKAGKERNINNAHSFSFFPKISIMGYLLTCRALY